MPHQAVVSSFGLKGVGICLMGDAGLYHLDCGDAARVRAPWWHNWYYSDAGCKSPGFAPTIWGTHFLGRTPSTIDGPLFGYNEPDRSDQANVDPVEAAQASAQMTVLYPNHQIIGATISLDTGTYDYYREYLAEIDRLGVQLYGLSGNTYLEMEHSVPYILWLKQQAKAREIKTVWIKEHFEPYLSLFCKTQKVYYGWFISQTPPCDEGKLAYSRPLIKDGELTMPWGQIYARL